MTLAAASAGRTPRYAAKPAVADLLPRLADQGMGVSSEKSEQSAIRGGSPGYPWLITLTALLVGHRLWLACARDGGLRRQHRAAADADPYGDSKRRESVATGSSG